VERGGDLCRVVVDVEVRFVDQPGWYRFASLQPESVRVLGAVAGLWAPAQATLEHPVPTEPRTASIPWPVSPFFLRLILGRTSKEIDATTEIWRATEASRRGKGPYGQ
jgi:hypothetical protein